MTTITFTLTGVVPSKKNAWRRGKGGKVYLPGQIQADIFALIWQAQSFRVRRYLLLKPTDRLRVNAHFVVNKENKDLDNMFTTLLDVLQAAQVIENDKLVRAFSVTETIAPGEQSVEVEIEVFSTVCEDCLGSGIMQVDEEDGEGHTMRGVGSEPCHCGIKPKKLSTATSRNKKQASGMMNGNARNS